MSLAASFEHSVCNIPGFVHLLATMNKLLNKHSPYVVGRGDGELFL